jgi:aryl-alcohol dehydrogenase-like predicted oxidoreductase
MSPGRRFEEGDTRKTNPLFRPEHVSEVNRILGELQPYASKYRATLSQLVTALTAVQRGITHVLVGARDAAQAKENAGAGFLDLADPDVKAMERIVARLPAAR